MKSTWIIKPHCRNQWKLVTIKSKKHSFSLITKFFTKNFFNANLLLWGNKYRKPISPGFCFIYFLNLFFYGKLFGLFITSLTDIDRLPISIYLSIYPSIHLSIYLSIYLASKKDNVLFRFFSDHTFGNMIYCYIMKLLHCLRHELFLSSFIYTHTHAHTHTHTHTHIYIYI